MRRLTLIIALVGCAPNHILHHSSPVPIWKYAVDLTGMTAGGAVGVKAQLERPSDSRDTRMALGYGVALMILIPYLFVLSP